jgi:hypothetical protein
MPKGRGFLEDTMNEEQFLERLKAILVYHGYRFVRNFCGWLVGFNLKQGWSILDANDKRVVGAAMKREFPEVDLDKLFPGEWYE